MQTDMKNKEATYEELVEDVKFQLTFESETLDWDHIIDTAEEAKTKQKNAHGCPNG